MKKVAFLCDHSFQYQLVGLQKILQEDFLICFFTKAELESLKKFNADMIITVHSFGEDISAFFNQSKAKSITIQDGIIEYAHSFLKKNSAARYKPVLTDYIFVLGERSKKILLSWSIPEEKILVTGIPRFDEYKKQHQVECEQDYLLVTSANTPWFSKKTKRLFYEKYYMLVEYLMASGINFRLRLPNRVLRLAPESFINLIKEVYLSKNDLLNDLCGAKAVISTPSTIVYEAMAMHKPFALFKTSSETVYTQAAWEFTDISDAKVIINELLDPPKYKLSFQELILNENCSNIGNASFKIANLVKSIINE